MKKFRLGLVWLAVTAVPAVSVAHHSYTMFDRSRQVTVIGTVEEFQMVNPHSWLDIISTDANGAQVKWSFEGGTYSQLIQRGVRANKTFKVGDKVTVRAFPLKDGRPGGRIVNVTTAEGKLIEMVPGGEK